MKKISVLLVLIFAVSSFFAVGNIYAVAETVSVEDFGAVASDGIDDSVQISEAINYAISNGIPTVLFDSGRYDFSLPAPDNLATTAYLKITNANKLTLLGSTDEEGNPDTILLRHNKLLPNEDIRRLLFLGYSKNVTVKNFTVDTYPYYYSAGTIDSVEGNKVTVTVLDGHPITDNMIANLPGVYNLSTRSFIKQRLILTAQDGSDAPHFTQVDSDTLTVENEAIAKGVSEAITENGQENVALFWFQASFVSGSQGLINYNCEDIVYDNVRILNTTGFALTSSYCNNVTYRRVSSAPSSDRIVSCPRDGFNIFNCRGTVLMDEITLDGMCDDGQNVHGEWFPILGKEGNTLIFSEYPQRYDTLEIGSGLALISSVTNQKYFESEIVNIEKNTEGNLEVTLQDSLPEDIVFSSDATTKEKTMADFLFFHPDKYILRNSVIRNVYRGVKLSAENAEIYGNTFEHNYYDIVMGGQNDKWYLESTHPKNVKIYNNSFSSSQTGTSIRAKYLFFTDLTPVIVNRDILIADNTFSDFDIALDISDTDNLFWFNNTFSQVGENIITDENTVSDIKNYSPADLYVSASGTNLSSVNNGDATKLYAVVRNQGEDTVSEPFSVDFYVDGRLFETILCDKEIAPGGFIIAESNMTWQSVFGTHTVRASVNSDNKFFEYYGNNNTLKSRVRVADV